VHRRQRAVRTVTLGVCLFVVAGGCSSGHASSNASSTTTTAPAAPTSTANPNLTPNAIPYEVGEQIGLKPWLVLLLKVRQEYSAPGLRPLPAGQQYLAIDLRMENQGPATYTVNANALFTLTDALHHEHFVVAVPGHPNGIDGRYRAGTTHTGRLVFSAPTGENLGLILYGPRIGTQVSYFTIVPPTVPAGD
jgi:hypothetical protein